MGRLVEPRRRFTLSSSIPLPQGASELSNKERLQDYAERVAKFVPAEVLAFYIAAVNLISTTPEASSTKRLWLFGGIGAFFWILTPVYIALYKAEPGVRRLNQVMAFVAFGVWMYAYPLGWFKDQKLDDPVIAGLLVIVFTAISGLVKPR